MLESDKKFDKLMKDARSLQERKRLKREQQKKRVLLFNQHLKDSASV